MATWKGREGVAGDRWAKPAARRKREKKTQKIHNFRRNPQIIIVFHNSKY